MTNTTGSGSGSPRKHTAGIFDIRNIIGTLMGIYGIVLLVVGLAGASATARHSAGDATNIWVGVALLIVAAFFLVWTQLRPTVVDEAELARDKAAAESDERPPAG